jgi:hypothetical protein
MCAAVGTLNVEYIKESEEKVIRQFITYLAANAARIGNNCSLGFYLQEVMEKMAMDYIDIYPMEREHVDQLYDWVKALPWPENGYLALAFNW